MNYDSHLRGKKLFEKIIIVWVSRSNPTESLTLNQIANLVFGSGTPQNAGIVGRTITEFTEYFYPPKIPSRKWQVNWTNVKRDYSHLGGINTNQVEEAEISPLNGMKQALDDELRAVRREMEEHPVLALAARELGMAGEGSFLYESVIELPGDSELPIPEGVDIQLRWQSKFETSIMDATLLSYDSLNSKVIFEVERPLRLQQQLSEFKILPKIDQLILSIRSKLLTLDAHPTALTWKLLRTGLLPQPKEWRNPLDERSLDKAQIRAVKRCLEQDITFLWGPPGTGKTHTLARLMANAALGGQKIIAAAIANVAVDQMALQLVRALVSIGKEGQALLNEGRVLRFGHPRLLEVSGESRLFPNKQEIQQIRKQLYEARQKHRAIPERDAKARALSQKVINDLTSELRRVTKKAIDNARIVLTTAVQVCLEPAMSDAGFNMMIVDEASMMPIPYLACMGMFGRDRLIIAGDFRQLGPIAVSRSKAAFDWLHKDAFELSGISNHLLHPALEMLTVQRRMHHEICSLINQPFYGGYLITDVDPKKTTASYLPPLPGKPVVFISFLPEDGSEVEQTEAGSRVNRGSAKIVVKLAKKLVYQDRQVQIGIIAPYRAQVSLVKRLLKEVIPDRVLSDRIKIGTIHAFQGSEADVIIWDLVETRNHPIGKPYREDTGNRLANVALSRAQGKLIIIGDLEAFFNAPGAAMVERLKGILSKDFLQQSSERVITVNEVKF